MEEVEVSVNWDVDNADRLRNLLICSSQENKECAIENVTQESCVRLTKGEYADADCKPELEIKSKNAIRQIDVLSEGSLIEVFGIHDEYLFTCESEFIDDWEGLAVYQASISLPGITTCKLKFTRIKDKDRLWLYSIQLLVMKLEEPSHLLFNLENVNNLINNSGQQISEKAEKFKKLFELFVKNSSTNQSLSIQNLFNVINRECNVEYLKCKQTMMDCLNNSNFINDKLRIGRGSSGKNSNEMSVEDQVLKDYIDNRLTEMKEDLIHHMDFKLQELRNDNNAKLDLIIKLLESKL